MTTPERQRVPEWAKKERAGDLEWIQENLYVLWPAAQTAFKEKGRGAIYIETSIVVEHPGGVGNPMAYMIEEDIEKSEKSPDALRMVRAYNPTWEVVIVLLEHQGKEVRESTYRIGVPSARKSL